MKTGCFRFYAYTCGICLALLQRKQVHINSVEQTKGKKMKRNLILKTMEVTTILVLSACAARAVKPGAEKVVVTHQQAPKSCKFKGTLVGNQGGFFTGRWTSNNRLALGAINDLKNQAQELGANYVVLENTTAGNTTTGSWGSGWGSGSIHGGQTDVTHTGNAYTCNPAEIGLAE